MVVGGSQQETLDPAFFETKKEEIKVNVIQCYAPINDSKGDDKAQFYENLKLTVEKCLGNDLIILKNDPNAKVGINNTEYEDIMGQHGLEETNENGDSFANLCEYNKMLIDGIIFPHRHIHKATWVSPHQLIDHICITEKISRTIKDMRTRRGANLASYHHLVVTKMNLLLKKHWTARETALKRFNTAFLRNPDELNEFKTGSKPYKIYSKKRKLL
ncbi:unnamed protein product [Schistosoma margrebowiei]|uniref:Uncharacterized protein n=1 Tax=Schistosoma margrebowiei TaxID=48269 RepID=A0A183LNG2_9TREM|nr:unnamed protein product [Schistosoma margrebowiei]